MSINNTNIQASNREESKSEYYSSSFAETHHPPREIRRSRRGRPTLEEAEIEAEIRERARESRERILRSAQEAKEREERDYLERREQYIQDLKEEEFYRNEEIPPNFNVREYLNVPEVVPEEKEELEEKKVLEDHLRESDERLREALDALEEQEQQLMELDKPKQFRKKVTPEERAKLARKVISIANRNQGLPRVIEYLIQHPILKTNQKGSTYGYYLRTLKNLTGMILSQSTNVNYHRLTREQQFEAHRAIQEVNNLIETGENGEHVEVDFQGHNYAVFVFSNIKYPDDPKSRLKVKLNLLNNDGTTSVKYITINNLFLGNVLDHIQYQNDYSTEYYKQYLEDLSNAYSAEFIILRRDAFEDVRQQKNGGFFIYNHLTDLDLKSLQIYKKGVDADDYEIKEVNGEFKVGKKLKSNQKEYDDGQVNCLIHCLDYYGFDDNAKLIVSKFITNGMVAKLSLKKIATQLQIKIITKELRDDGTRNKTRTTVYMPKKEGNRKKVKVKKTIELGIAYDHYFPLIDIKCSSFALKNYSKVKDQKEWNQIIAIRKNGTFIYSPKRNEKVNSLKLVELMIQNKEELLERMSNKKLMKVSPKDYDTSTIKPIEDDNESVPVTFRKKNKEYSALLAFDTEASPFGNHEVYCAALIKFDNGFIKKSKKQLKEEEEEKERNYVPDWVKQEIKVDYSVLGKPISAIGPDCVKEIFTRLPVNKIKVYEKEVGKGKKKKKVKVEETLPYMCLVHNLKYDLSFIKDHLTEVENIIRNNGKTMVITGKIGGRIIEFRDSLRMINKPLSKFGKLFKLDQEKEIMPYTAYTKKTINQRSIKLSTAKKNLKSDSDWEQMHENLVKLDLINKGNKTFDHIKYARYYCEKDVEVLAKGYMNFRAMMKQVTKLDIKDYISIPSIAHDYFKKNECYEGCTELRGIARDYIQKCVVGGRCQLFKNESYDNKIDLEVNEDGSITKSCVEKLIQDFDACSLYPSAMQRLGSMKTKIKTRGLFGTRSNGEKIMRTMEKTSTGGYLQGSPIPFDNEGKIAKIANNDNDRFVYKKRECDKDFGGENVTMYERVNVDILNTLLKYGEKLDEYFKNLKMHNQHKRKMMYKSNQEMYGFKTHYHHLKEYAKLVDKNGYAKIIYKRSKNVKNKVGRLYSHRGASLQGIKRKVRQVLSREFYQDIDMVNAHPTILMNLARIHGLEHQYIEEYVNNREQIIKDVMEINPEWNRDDVKELILAVMNGGQKNYRDLPNKTEFIEKFKEQVTTLMYDINEVVDYSEHVNMEKESIVPKPVRATNILLTDYENKILEVMYNHFKNKNDNGDFHCSLQFDGICVPRHEKNEEYLRECEKEIKRVLDMNIKLKIKEMDNYMDMEDFLWFVTNHGDKDEVMDYEKLSKMSGYFVTIRLTNIGQNRAFPVISEYRDGKRNWDNKITREYAIDKITLEDLIEFNGIEPGVDFHILHGYYFDSGRNDKIYQIINKLYNNRLIKKNEVYIYKGHGRQKELLETHEPTYEDFGKFKEFVNKWKKKVESMNENGNLYTMEVGNPIQEIYKLLMNSAYGKTIMKPVKTEYSIIDSTDALDKAIMRNHNKMIEAIPIGNTDKYLVKESKPFDRHQSMPHIGVEILSMSKRIMNEVMCLGEDIGCKIWYQDTDSMHISNGDVEKLSKAFKDKYGRELIGNSMGQFHSDFEKIQGKYKVLGSMRNIGLGKKSYYDKLVGYDENGEIVYGEHSRMKAVPPKILNKTAKDMGRTIEELYEYHYNGNEVAYNLSKYDDVPCFGFRKDGTVMTMAKNGFIRRISF